MAANRGDEMRAFSEQESLKVEIHPCAPECNGNLHNQFLRHMGRQLYGEQVANSIDLPFPLKLKPKRGSGHGGLTLEFFLWTEMSGAYLRVSMAPPKTCAGFFF